LGLPVCLGWKFPTLHGNGGLDTGADGRLALLCCDGRGVGGLGDAGDYGFARIFVGAAVGDEDGDG